MPIYLNRKQIYHVGNDVRIEYPILKFEYGSREHVEHILNLYKSRSLAQVRSNPNNIVQVKDREGGLLEVLWIAYLVGECLGYDVWLGAWVYYRNVGPFRFDLYVELDPNIKVLYAIRALREASTSQSLTGGVEILHYEYTRLVKFLKKNGIHVRGMYIIETNVEVKEKPYFVDTIRINGTRRDLENVKRLIEYLKRVLVSR